jgi:hypothetical protein
MKKSCISYAMMFCIVFLISIKVNAVRIKKSSYIDLISTYSNSSLLKIPFSDRSQIDIDFNKVSFEPFTLRASYASSLVKRVDFYINGEKLSVDKDAPFNLIESIENEIISWSAKDGLYKIKVVPFKTELNQFNNKLVYKRGKSATFTFNFINLENARKNWGVSLTKTPTPITTNTTVPSFTPTKSSSATPTKVALPTNTFTPPPNTPVPTVKASATPIPNLTSTPIILGDRKLPPPDAKLAHAYGLWSPSKFDTCPKWLHDTYWVYGPDGRVYPTWHPATTINPETGKTCTFGHEHGRDPAGSRLAKYGVPFGYINEQLAMLSPEHPRHEDHVGHKVEYKNRVKVDIIQGSATTCDIFAKLHQGTHSPDAFTNNMHELFYYVECDNGVGFRYKGMHLFGKPGEFKGTCKGDTFVGQAVPANSPASHDSTRGIPDAECYQEWLAKEANGQNTSSEFYTMWIEDWTSGFIHELKIDRPGHHGPKNAYYDNYGQIGANRHPETLIEFYGGSYFRVENTSRYFDPSKPNNIGRQLDMCFTNTSGGSHPDCRAAKEELAKGNKITWDNPLSPFNGSKRIVHFDTVRVWNRTDQTVWYSNPMGTIFRPAPDPANNVVIEQYISKTPEQGVIYGFGNRSTADRTMYDTTGVHAPN